MGKFDHQNVLARKPYHHVRDVADIHIIVTNELLYLIKK